MKSILSTLTEKRQRHAERHRPTGLGFVLADRIEYLNAGDWDRVVSGQSLFLSRRYVTVVQTTRPSVLDNRYAVIYRGADPVAVLSAQLIEVRPAQLSSHGWTKGALAALHQRLLICGNILSWGMHGVAFAPSEDTAALWPAVAEALYRMRRAEKLTGQTDFILLKDLPIGRDRGAEALKRFSYRPLETEPDMVLEIPPEWKTFDDYLKSLTSKYRSTIVRGHKAVLDAGLIVEPMLDLTSHAGVLHGLYLQVQQAAQVKLITLTPEYLPELSRVLGDDFRCTQIRRGTDVLGFMTTLRDGETAVGYIVGFDRKANETAPIYFRLLSAAIEDAIALGCRRLSLGRTALEPKARLGARPVPTAVWLRHRNPFFNVMVRQILGAVPHGDAPDRQPFK